VAALGAGPPPLFTFTPKIYRPWLTRSKYLESLTAMRGDAAIQDALVLDVGMRHFPQYNHLLTPFMLYGLPALYLVSALAGHFLMRRFSTCASAACCWGARVPPLTLSLRITALAPTPSSVVA